MKYVFITDLHLSPNKPIARKEKTREDWINTQINKMKQVFEYCRNNKIETLLCGGDVFNHHKFNDSIDFSIKIIELFNTYSDINFVTLYGNHDLRYHQLENLMNSELGLLTETTTNVKEIKPFFDFNNEELVRVQFFHYGQELNKRELIDGINIAIVHENIFEKTVPPYMSGYTVKELREVLPGYDLYLCGHNHQKFIVKNKDYIVLNGGSIMRLNTKQKDFKPAFWEIEIINGNIEVKEILFDIKPDMISTEHLKKNKMESFVESTKEFEELDGFDFRKDVENAIKKEQPIEEVKAKIYNSLEE